jgi:hypothetical protein
MDATLTTPPPSLDWSDPFRLTVGTAGWKPRPRVTSRAVIDFVAKRYGFSARDLVGPWRPQKLADVRHIAMWTIRQTTTLSYPQISDVFSRDHSTVVHAVQRVNEAVATASPLGIEAMECLAAFEGKQISALSWGREP